jgi:protein tyrosine phosphatase (PTP) superfamily phosphohydrolase (DUF442 family)
MSDEPKNSLRSRWRRNLLVIAGFALFLGGVNFIYFEYFQTYHLVEVDPGKVYRDGNRSLREFRNAVRRAKPKTIVAVIDHEEYNQPEFVEAREYSKAHGVEWIWIPVKAGAFPKPEHVKQFLAIAREPKQQPVLFHDDEGIRRAGMMMAAYQMSAMGYDRDRAKASIRAFNHSDRTIADVRRFIDAYDPVNGLPYDLNPTPTTTPATTRASQ